MRKTIIGICLLALLVSGYVLGNHWLQTSVASSIEPTPAAVRDDPYVHASARVVPAQYAELAFAVSGTVAQVAVA